MKVLYEGADIYPEISVRRCYHEMYAGGQSDSLLLCLNDTRELWDRWNPKRGDVVAVEDGAARTGKMFVDSVAPEAGLLTLRAYSMPPSAKNSRGKSWESVSFLQLVQEIAERHNLTIQSYGITDRKYSYVEQNNQPDFAFLQTRCILESAAFLVYDGGLVVYNEPYLENQQPADTIQITPANEFTYRRRELYGAAEITNGTLTGVFSAPSGDGQTLKRLLSVPMTDRQEADRFARGILRDANRDAASATLWASSLLRDYAPGSVVTLKTEGAASWDGPAFVWRLRHDYVKSRSKIFLRRPLEGY